MPVSTLAPAEVIRKLSDDAAFDRGYYLPAYDTGGATEGIVAEYRRLRSDLSRMDFCRSLAYGLQRVDCLSAGRQVRADAADSFYAYLEARCGRV